MHDQATMVKMSPGWMVTPPMSNAGPVTGDLRERAALLGVREVEERDGRRTRTASWRARERPIAVISGASRGACRRGR